MNTEKFQKSNLEIVALVGEVISPIGTHKDHRYRTESVWHHMSNGQVKWFPFSPPGHFLWPREGANAYSRETVMPWASWTWQREDGPYAIHVGRNVALVAPPTGPPRPINAAEMEEALEALFHDIAADLSSRSLADVALKVAAKEKGSFALLKKAKRLHEETK